MTNTTCCPAANVPLGAGERCSPRLLLPPPPPPGRCLSSREPACLPPGALTLERRPPGLFRLVKLNYTSVMQEEQLPEAAADPMSSSNAPEDDEKETSDASPNIYVHILIKFVADADAFKILLDMKMKKRQKKPNLPSTVTELVTEEGSKVFVVGTAHFSDSSKRDVVKTIQEVQPDVVVVELCQYRVSMLKMDEKTLLKEAKEINLEKLQQAIKQAGKVPFCKFHLGDRPIPVTFKRAIAALSFWQKVKLAWGLCFLSDPISKDDVEKCKQKDLLEQMMAEMIGEFPDLHRTIVSERDIYLTYMLKQAAKRIELPRASETEPRKCIPSVVVGVVGMGHVPGIEKNWNTDLNIQEIMSVPPPSTSSKVLRFVIKATVFGLMGYGCYQVGQRTVQFILSMPTTQNCLQRLMEIRPRH
ncbi:traB domain-containing protein isoform X3 [Dermochelys coriacea]|uniref:traB domain-containing protein isoform X3 n=1 Tax=Dermochelys coriacea TaxID=27794 RepID=UPI001CA951E4|nr:traB domain-containing protein isoform X3 [Dermochelys coriacea]